MKATDLMIGDWVMSLREDHSGEYCQVIDISHHDTVLLEYHRTNYYTNIEHIKPISITEEVLKKNGFMEIEEGYYKWDSHGDDEESEVHYEVVRVYLDSKITANVKSLNICEFNGIVNYVHELQHALRLCEIDKEIEL